MASLRDLAVAIAKLQIRLLAANGRIGGIGAARKDQQKAQFLDALKSLGLTDDQLFQVAVADREWVIIDYVIWLLSPLNTSQDQVKAEAYRNAIEREEPATPEQCKKILDEFSITDENTKELLKDYEYYYETGKQRRPDVWRQRING